MVLGDGCGGHFKTIDPIKLLILLGLQLLCHPSETLPYVSPSHH